MVPLRTAITVLLTHIILTFLLSFIGLPQSTKLRPLEGDEDASLSIYPSITGQPETAVGEKNKRKRKPSSSSGSEVKPKKRVARKPKKSTGSRVLNSDSLLQLKYES